MYKFQVGKPYSETRSTWPEAVEYNWMPRLHELRLFFKNPENQEIQAVRSGNAEFGLVIEQDIIFLLFRFHGAQKNQKGIEWSDASYNWHLMQRSPSLEDQDRDVLPKKDLGPEERCLLNVMLVDATTGILLAIRVVSLSHTFTEKLFQAISTQAVLPFQQEQYNARLARIYDTTSPVQLLKRAVVRCTGGD